MRHAYETLLRLYPTQCATYGREMADVCEGAIGDFRRRGLPDGLADFPLLRDCRCARGRLCHVDRRVRGTPAGARIVSAVASTVIAALLQ